MISRPAAIVLAGVLMIACRAQADDAVAWEVDLRNDVVYQAWNFGDSVYLMLPGNSARTTPLSQPTPGLAPLTYQNEQGFPPGPTIAAIDVKTGKIRWVRGYIGEFLFVPDPTGSNDLWALASTCQRLDAATGRTMQTVPIPAQAKKDERRGDRPWRMVHGLRVKGQVSWGANRFGRDVQDPVQVFDIDNKEIVSVKAINLRTENKLDQIDLDVDQSPQLVQTHVQMRPIGGGNAKWKFTTAGYSGNRPMLFGRDVVVLSGMPDTVGAVTRLDPDSGAPRWTTRLPRGAYVIGQRQLRDGWYGYETWSAIGQLNNQYLFAIGGDGEVFVLDAETGRIVGSSRHVSLHLAPPRLVGDQLVMIGDTRAVSVSFAAVLGKVVPQAVSDRATASARATENRQPAEAVRLAEEAISRWPGNADAWMALSNATRAAGNDTAAVRAACRALELSRQPTTDWLRDRFGLIARIDTGPLRAPVALMGLFLYAPSTNGLLYVIDPETRKVVEERPMQGDASSAIWQDQQLIRQGNDRRREIIATTPDTAERPLREDPLYPHVEVTVASGASRRVKQRTLPQEWTRVGGGIGGEIKIDGRTIRTVTGGGTRELIGEEMTVHEPVMLGVKEWFFVQTAAGPLGCGVGGVYALDANYRPATFLVDWREEGTDSGIPTALTVDSDKQTLAVVLRRPSKKRLAYEIRSADGSKVIRTEQVAPPGRFDDLSREHARVFKLRDGYFYAGGELAWIPIDPAKTVWRFAVNDDPDAPRDNVRDDPTDHAFGLPRMSADRLLIPNRYGGIYVFDIAKITGTKP